MTGFRRQLARYFSFAQRFVEEGLPCVVPDVTNVVGLGDVLIVIEPSGPDIVEFKRKRMILPDRIARYLDSAKPGDEAAPLLSAGLPKRGRTGRQVSEIVARTSYMRDERGRFPGDGFDRIAVTVDLPDDRLLADIDIAVGEALETGAALRACSDFQAVFAVHTGHDLAPDDLLSDITTSFSLPVVAENRRPWHSNWWAVSPPTEWNLSPENARLLMEGTVILFHLVDFRHFETLSGDGVHFEVVLDDERPYLYGGMEGQNFQLGDKLLWDLLFGFERLESVAARAALLLKSARDHGIASSGESPTESEGGG